ncbi:hypothetical protein LBMAG56_27950 [Verrucomicrobiota bacterium]|nr:hypothetical protein LBMAG56_27950 [Verrucomicrobiota bacterium]
MFSLQQLFGKGDRFFELLEASAEEALTSVQLLIRLLNTTPKPTTLDDFVFSRRKDKRLTEQISEELVKTFVTGLEREDIETLSNALYKIPKTVEKFAERYELSLAIVSTTDFSKQADLMGKAAEAVVALVRQLRDLQQLERTKELNDRLQYVEGEADKLMLVLLKDLYSGKHDPLKVIIVRDLYELIEKVIDRCRDAGNVVSHIVLKNS